MANNCEARFVACHDCGAKYDPQIASHCCPVCGTFRGRTWAEYSEEERERLFSYIDGVEYDPITSSLRVSDEDELRRMMP